MATPFNLEKGQSTTRPPYFNGQYYGWWNTRMHDFVMTKDSELWDIICDGPRISMKNVKKGNVTKLFPRTRKKYDEDDRKRLEKSYKEKKLLVCEIGLDEYNRTLACESTKEIQDCLKTEHVVISKVEEFKVDTLTTKYEAFTIKESETI